jgi:hypothetical protein
LNTISTAMSTGSDPIWNFPSEGIDDENIYDHSFFAPYLQADAPPPEIFDTDSWDRDWDNNWTPPKFIDTLTVAPCPFTPIGAPSELTFSTESSDDFSQYSYGSSPSDSSVSLDMATRGSMGNEVYAAGNDLYSAPTMFSDDPPSFGPLPPSPPLHPVSAPSDYGISDPSQSLCAVSPNDLVLPMQQIAITASPPPPPLVQMAVETHKPKPPFRPFKCPFCKHGRSDPTRIYNWLTVFLLASDRKFNLKTHMETHNKKGSKRFVCGTCKRGCTRKHDLLRHCKTVHGQAMPPSASRARRCSRTVPETDPPHEDQSSGLVEFDDDIMALFMDKEL